MPSLLFDVNGQRYGLAIDDIVEVVPAVRLRRLPGAPAYVAGVLRYRGAIVPVLDLNQMMDGRPAVRRFSTRIVLVRQSGEGDQRLLGLLVERATDTVEDDGGTVDVPVRVPEAPFLGGLHTGAVSFQRVRVNELLSEEARQRLLAGG